MSVLRNTQITLGENEIFPQVQNIDIESGISYQLKNNGKNAVKVTCDDSSDSRMLEGGEVIRLVSNSDAVDDSIEIEFYAPTIISLDYIDGISSGGGGGASDVNIISNSTDFSTATKQDQQKVVLDDILTDLSQLLETIEFIEATGAGTTPANVKKIDLLFLGNGGSLNGIVVPNGFSVSYEASLGNKLTTIGYIAPTIPSIFGAARLLISYVI